MVRSASNIRCLENMEGTRAAFDDDDNLFSEKPGLPPRPPIKTENATKVPARKPVGLSGIEKDLIEKTHDLKLDTFQTPPPLYEEETVILDSPNLVQSPTSVSTSDSLSTAPSKWKTAMEDARHFAGGLVSHPFESTKHFSILRHSHGLVYYKGPSTSLAITLFSDKPLPPRPHSMGPEERLDRQGRNESKSFASHQQQLDQRDSI